MKETQINLSENIVLMTPYNKKVDGTGRWRVSLSGIFVIRSVH